MSILMATSGMDREEFKKRIELLASPVRIRNTNPWHLTIILLRVIIYNRGQNEEQRKIKIVKNVLGRSYKSGTEYSILLSLL